MSATPTLATPRFTLRPLRAGDERALYPAFSDMAAMRYWSRAPFADVAALREWLFDPDWDGRTWIAEPRGGGAPVARLIASPAGDEVAEIGYIVLPDSWGQGIARECLAVLVTHLFRAENHHRLFADVDPRNVASNRLLQSLGFAREAHLREAMRTHIGWCDTWLWGLLADEWNPDRGD